MQVSWMRPCAHATPRRGTSQYAFSAFEIKWLPNLWRALPVGYFTLATKSCIWVESGPIRFRWFVKAVATLGEGAAWEAVPRDEKPPPEGMNSREDRSPTDTEFGNLRCRQ